MSVGAEPDDRISSGRPGRYLRRFRQSQVSCRCDLGDPLVVRRSPTPSRDLSSVFSTQLPGVPAMIRHIQLLPCRGSDRTGLAVLTRRGRRSRGRSVAGEVGRSIKLDWAGGAVIRSMALSGRVAVAPPKRHAFRLIVLSIQRTTRPSVIASTRRGRGRKIFQQPICPGGQAPDWLRARLSDGVKFSVSSPRLGQATAPRNRPRPTGPRNRFRHPPGNRMAGKRQTQPQATPGVCPSGRRGCVTSNQNRCRLEQIQDDV